MIAATLLRRLKACPEAIAWVGNRDLATAWAECYRGDWMLWLAARLNVDRRIVVRAACACARTALPYVPAGDDRPRVAIEMAEAWCRGEATLDAVKDAADAVDTAYVTATCADVAAANAAEAVNVANVAYAAKAAYAATNAAKAAYYSANSTAADAAAKTHAEIVRSIINTDMIEATLSQTIINPI